MSRLTDLLTAYQEFIALPWTMDAAPEQRVIFGIYEPVDELKMRAEIDSFELATKEANHQWAAVDIEKTFSAWLSKMKYKEKYFQRPEVLPTVMERYAAFLIDHIKSEGGDALNNDNAVVAIYGTGSLFGLLRVKQMIDLLASAVAGRLLIFFPGSYENNNFRLLNGYDGWNYLAIVLNK